MIIDHTVAAPGAGVVSVRAWSRRAQPGTLAPVRMRSSGLQVV